MHGRGEFLHERDRRGIEDRVHGVEAQTVEMEISDPPDGILGWIAPHVVAARID